MGTVWRYCGKYWEEREEKVRQLEKQEKASAEQAPSSTPQPAPGDDSVDQAASSLSQVQISEQAQSTV